MIIVKTKNGDHFINDKAVVEVSHNKQTKVVSYYGAGGQFDNIQNVEEVIYVSDPQAIEYHDEGSKVKKLEKTIADITAEKEYYRKHMQNDCRAANIAYMTLFDSVETELKKEEGDRSWGGVEYSFEETKKMYEKYFDFRNNLINEWENKK